MELLVKVFEPSKEITLTTDASWQSILGILSQGAHPIMYLSKLNVELNIKKKALEIVWMTTKSCYDMITDHYNLY